MKHVNIFRGNKVTLPNEIVYESGIELSKYPNGIWIRKLARIIKEPFATVYKYVTIQEKGYPGEEIEIAEEFPSERGGNIIIKLKKVI